MTDVQDTGQGICNSLCKISEALVSVPSACHINHLLAAASAVLSVAPLVLACKCKMQSKRERHHEASESAADRGTADVERPGAYSQSKELLGRVDWGKAYPSDEGKAELLTKEEHCPIVVSTAKPTPFFVSPPWLLNIHVTLSVKAGKTPQAASQTPVYLAPMLSASWTVARSRYPTKPTRDEIQMNHPRWPTRSDHHATRILSKNAARYTGAVTPCALIDEKPILFTMVGRKFDSPEKE